MKTKHTPGPWITEKLPVNNEPDADYIPLILGADRSEVASVFSDAGQAGRVINARLIAAAPELLAALESLTATARTFRNVPKPAQEWTALDDEALAAAFAAIAKARGNG